MIMPSATDSFVSNLSLLSLAQLNLCLAASLLLQITIIQNFEILEPASSQ